MVGQIELDLNFAHPCLGVLVRVEYIVKIELSCGVGNDVSGREAGKTKTTAQ